MLPFKFYGILGHLGGSVVECLPLAQSMILGSWDRVPHQDPHREPASPSAYIPASLCVSLMNKYINFFFFFFLRIRSLTD